MDRPDKCHKLNGLSRLHNMNCIVHRPDYHYHKNDAFASIIHILENLRVKQDMPLWSCELAFIRYLLHAPTFISSPISPLLFNLFFLRLHQIL